MRVNEHRGERGQILPLIAVCLAVLLGFAGFAVDLGYMQYELRQQQTAADAAAIGGARELITAGCASPVAAKTAAKNDASENGFTDGTNKVKVTAYNPPQTGALTSNGCAVQVTVYSPHATFFGKNFPALRATQRRRPPPCLLRVPSMGASICCNPPARQTSTGRMLTRIAASS